MNKAVDKGYDYWINDDRADIDKDPVKTALKITQKQTLKEVKKIIEKFSDRKLNVWYITPKQFKQRLGLK